MKSKTKFLFFFSYSWTESGRVQSFYVTQFWHNFQDKHISQVAGQVPRALPGRAALSSRAALTPNRGGGHILLTREGSYTRLEILRLSDSLDLACSVYIQCFFECIECVCTRTGAYLSASSVGARADCRVMASNSSWMSDIFVIYWLYTSKWTLQESLEKIISRPRQPRFVDTVLLTQQIRTLN